jgi:hypothetical protein
MGRDNCCDAARGIGSCGVRISRTLKYLGARADHGAPWRRSVSPSVAALSSRRPIPARVEALVDDYAAIAAELRRLKAENCPDEARKDAGQQDDRPLLSPRHPVRATKAGELLYRRLIGRRTVGGQGFRRLSRGLSILRTYSSAKYQV